MEWTPERIAAARAYLLARGLIDAAATDDEVCAEADRQQADAFRAVGLSGSRADASPSIRPVDFSPETIDEENRTVQVTLATENRVIMIDYARWEYVDEVLLMDGYDTAGLRANGRITMLDSHRRGSVRDVLGSMYDLTPADTELRATAQFSEVEQDAWTKTREGHLDGVSVGYRVEESLTIEAGATAEVNGRTWTAGDRPLKLATRWTPVEGSPCPLGADHLCGTRSASASSVPATRSKPPKPNTNPSPTPATGEPTMTREEIINALTGKGYTRAAATFWADKLAKLPEAERKDAVEAMDARSANGSGSSEPPAGNTEPPAGNTPEDSRAAVQAEVARQNDIREASRALAARFPRVTQLQELTESALRGEGEFTTADQLRLEVLRLSDEQRPQMRVVADQGDHVRTVVRATVAERLRLEHKTDEERAIARQYGGYSMMELARMTLEANGVDVPRDKRLLASRALTQASGDFSNALVDAANVVLLAMFEAQEATWRRYCAIEDVPDFKTLNLVKMSLAGGMEEVAEGEESPLFKMTDAKETLTLATYAKRFAITRQAIINDQVGIFNRQAIAHAIAWAQKLNYLGAKGLMSTANLADGSPLFHANHSNLDTTTAAITSKDTATAVLREAKRKLRRQTDLDGVTKLSIMPRLCLGVPEKEEYLATAIGETGRADNNSEVDIRRMNLELVIEPQLENTEISGATDHTFLLADPMAYPVVVMGLLDGDAAPFLDDRENFTTDGIEMKVRGDAASAVADFRGAVKHKK